MSDKYAQEFVSSDENEFLEAAESRPDTSERKRRRTEDRLASEPESPEVAGEKERTGLPSQWATAGGAYRPTTATVQKLPAGVYDIDSDQYGPFVIPALPPSGLLLELPEMRSDHVLQLVDRFWASEADYKDGNEFVIGGAAFKAGVMIFGPPGSGKSCTIKLLSRKLVQKGGTVFFASCHPGTCNAILTAFARVEPNRKCIVILEDIDSLIERYGEVGFLEMLDSAKTIDNVLFIATTNYPDRLDPRIYNRPGRFSHVVKIGMPTPPARKAFLEAILKNHRDIPEIVAKTDGFSIDHLTALTNSVYREHKELGPEIERLRNLFRVPKSDDKGPMGLGG